MPQPSKNRATTLGKFIALVLRHQPDAAGLTLDKEGYAQVSALLANRAQPMTREELDYVVATDSKGRYAYDNTRERIRANQGHSLRVDVGLKQAVPPAKLYHGTADRSVNAILREGLKPMSRQHVHMSASEDTAVDVGGRHGKATVLLVDALDAHEDGIKFYLSENGVWLADVVPAQYLSLA
jgi:putative RNA 2'-phosphotransferase